MRLYVLLLVLLYSFQLISQENKYKINAEYKTIKADKKNIPEVIKKIREKEISGINITLPFKQLVIPFLDKLVNYAKETNSVNTVYLN